MEGKNAGNLFVFETKLNGFEGSQYGRLDYQPLFGKMSPHSSPERALFGEDQRPDPGDGGNRA